MPRSRDRHQPVDASLDTLNVDRVLQPEQDVTVRAGTEVARAPAHAAASDMTRSSKLDQWLALLILGDLDPYTPPITPRVSLPTRSTSSQISTAYAWPEGGRALGQEYG